MRGRRIESIRTLGRGHDLPFELRLSAVDRILGTDGLCDVVIDVPDESIDPLITVIDIVGGFA